MTDKVVNISLSLPGSPEVLAIVSALVELGRVSRRDDDWISLKQAAEESPYSYYSLRQMVVIDRVVPFTRPSGKPRGMIFIRRGDLRLLMSGDNQKVAKGGGITVADIVLGTGPASKKEMK